MEASCCRSEHGPKQEFTDAAAEYSSRGRCGISDISGGVEGYLVPPSDLAERLLKTAYLAEGRDLRRESDGVPEELGTDQMLLLLVHLKVCHFCEDPSVLMCCLQASRVHAPQGKVGHLQSPVMPDVPITGPQCGSEHCIFPLQSVCCR